MAYHTIYFEVFFTHLKVVGVRLCGCVVVMLWCCIACRELSWELVSVAQRNGQHNPLCKCPKNWNGAHLHVLMSVFARRARLYASHPSYTIPTTHFYPPTNCRPAPRFPDKVTLLLTHQRCQLTLIYRRRPAQTFRQLL